MTIGVLLSGSGVYDGSEIHEAVSTLIALDQLGQEVQCLAPDIDQYHVVNHLTGEEMNQKRNVFIESARIARGNIKTTQEISSLELDGLVIPGGFGAAKNFTTWAFSGPECDIEPSVKKLIQDMVAHKKPLVFLCVSPVVLAKALQGSSIGATITFGRSDEPSPYDIESFNRGVTHLGFNPLSCSVGDIIIDSEHKIITSPCYMMETSIAFVYEGVYKSCEKLVELCQSNTNG